MRWVPLQPQILRLFGNARAVGIVSILFQGFGFSKFLEYFVTLM